MTKQKTSLLLLKKYWRGHIMYNWKKPYKCRYVGCGIRFVSAASVQKHIKKFHPQHVRRVIAGTKPICRMVWK